jgi:serine/threonine protein kinase
MIGRHILNYEIKSLIGEGGMGAVYLAEHTQVRRKVAVKVLHPQFLKNQEIRTRFKNEASMMAHLQHPNIVSLFDYVEDDSGMYLIMEFVEGTPLDEYIEQVTGPMPEFKVVPIMKQILEAFNYAHDKKIVHRDIKPANVLIGQNGDVKILDFGIARILGDGGHNLTKTGTQMGTVFYMSPEQVQGKKVDHRSDIYSLGVTFYQMLTGINPYKSITTEYEVYSKIVSEELPNPKEIYPGIADYLVPILKKALNKSPEDRYESCKDFLNAIENKTLASYSSSKQKRNNNESLSTSQNGGTGALVLGLLALLLSLAPLSLAPYVNLLALVLAIIAIVLGNKVNSSQGRTGKTLAIVALILSGIILFNSFYLIYLKDSDSDGYPDRKDECPSIFGKLKGCPDSDKDGVENSSDNCPYLAGSTNHSGCPDSDGDRVYEDLDECDSEAGPEENNGCPWPDSDDDGIPNKDDQCPYESGPFDNNGCPHKNIDNGYENEAGSYTTYCPFCGAGWNLEEYDKMWQCSNCSKDFFNCYKSNGEYGAIKGNWVGDGGCDCNNCTDEK